MLKYNKKQEKTIKNNINIIVKYYLYMRFFQNLMSLASFVCSTDVCHNTNNNCLTFSVGSGTGCAWMCQYCATNLGTNNYYFTDGVCTYEDGTGCVGNPIAGKSYTCCAA
jgi:hypothetical protein